MRALLALDQRLIERLDHHRSRRLDIAFTGVSRAANRAALWMGMAAALGRWGGERGRRAAQRGVVAIALASTVANGPVKLTVRRARRRDREPLVRMPSTSSLPSGHAASAFAFVVAVSRELPRLAPVLYPLAAAVAYSRVYVGVHYPSDVVVGAALGAGAGLSADAVVRAAGLARYSV